MSRNFELRDESYLQLLIIILLVNLIWVVGSYFYHLNSTEGVISSLRLLLSSILVYLFCNRIYQDRLISFLIYFISFNGILIGFQVLEQVLNLNLLPTFLKYGGIWGFWEDHDYEVFRKGGIFPSSQTSSILSLFVASFLIYKKQKLLLLFPISLGLLFGGRTTFVLAIVLISWVLFYSSPKVLSFPRLRVLSFLKTSFYLSLSILIIYFALDYWFSTDIGGHHLFRIQQVFNVLVLLDFTSNISGGTAFEFFKIPTSGIEAFIGNGYPRYHELGGNDPFYSRWLTQSGLPSLVFLLAAFTICFFVERKRTPSYGILMVLLLLQGFKGEVVSSIVFFDIYLFYLFSNRGNLKTETYKVNLSA